MIKTIGTLFANTGHDKILHNTKWCLNKEFEVCVFVMFDLMSALQLGLITRHKPSHGGANTISANSPQCQDQAARCYVILYIQTQTYLMVHPSVAQIHLLIFCVLRISILRN